MREKKRRNERVRGYTANYTIVGRFTMEQPWLRASRRNEFFLRLDSRRLFYFPFFYHVPPFLSPFLSHAYKHKYYLSLFFFLNFLAFLFATSNDRLHKIITLRSFKGRYHLEIFMETVRRPNFIFSSFQTPSGPTRRKLKFFPFIPIEFFF